MHYGEVCKSPAVFQKCEHYCIYERKAGSSRNCFDSLSWQGPIFTPYRRPWCRNLPAAPTWFLLSGCDLRRQPTVGNVSACVRFCKQNQHFWYGSSTATVSGEGIGISREPKNARQRADSNAKR